MNKINTVLLTMSCLLLTCTCAMASPVVPPPTPEPGAITMFLAIGASAVGVMLRRRRANKK